MTMTAAAPRSARVAAPRAAALTAAAGCTLLLLRPAVVAHVAHPAAALVALFLALAAVGMGWPSTPSRLLVRQFRISEPTHQKSFGVGPVILAVGIAAFAVGRVLSSGHPPTRAVGLALAANSLAAVAEEAFFRRFLFGLLEPYGAGLAIAGSAVLFAVVHVTVYGLWVLPVDLAAGALLSWQRWATGSWTVPAVTHVIANVLVVV
jgi:membrane protease YdiL (CAAX protease family)